MDPDLSRELDMPALIDSGKLKSHLLNQSYFPGGKPFEKIDQIYS